MPRTCEYDYLFSTGKGSMAALEGTVRECVFKFELDVADDFTADLSQELVLDSVLNNNVWKWPTVLINVPNSRGFLWIEKVSPKKS